MHARDDDRLIIYETKIQPVGKSSQKRPPGIAVNNRILERTVGYGLGGFAYGLQKLIAQSGALVFVP